LFNILILSIHQIPLPNMLLTTATIQQSSLSSELVGHPYLPTSGTSAKLNPTLSHFLAFCCKQHVVLRPLPCKGNTITVHCVHTVHRVAPLLYSQLMQGLFVHIVHCFHGMVQHLHRNCTDHDEGSVICLLIIGLTFQKGSSHHNNIISNHSSRCFSCYNI